MPSPWSYDVKHSPLMTVPTVTGFGVRPALPLQGLTVLVAEDSRYACEALRLMCQRAGARLRRAETLALARSHLRVYRPDVVIIDLGLPDGRGEALIAELAQSSQRPKAILGTSGDPMGRAQALEAGADGFLDKPYASFATFCASVASHLPDREGFSIDAMLPAPCPDPLALHDDLVVAARAMAGDPDAATRRYVAGFLSGIARHAQDAGLARAAADANTDTDTDASDTDRGFRQLREVVADRLVTTNAFLPQP